MRINKRVVIDIATDKVIERESYEYSGPLALAVASYNKFNVFVSDLGLKQINLNTDQINAYLSNHQPLAADTVVSDAPEITTEHGYTGPVDTTNLYSASNGTGTCSGTSITITATGGTVGPFKFVILNNITMSTPHLMAWWEYEGAALTLQDGETFTIRFNSVQGAGGTICTIQ